MSGLLRNVSDHLLPDNRGCFLDAGSGHSADAALACKAWGFDSAIKMDLWPPYPEHYSVSWKRGHDKIEGGKVRFIQGDICKLTDYVPSGSVDMIGCAAVLDLLSPDDRQLFYSEAYDALHPGGVLAMSYVALKHGHGEWRGPDELDDMLWEKCRCSKNLVIARKAP